ALDPLGFDIVGGHDQAGLEDGGVELQGDRVDLGADEEKVRRLMEQRLPECGQTGLDDFELVFGYPVVTRPENWQVTPLHAARHALQKRSGAWLQAVRCVQPVQVGSQPIRSIVRRRGMNGKELNGAYLQQVTQ